MKRQPPLWVERLNVVKISVLKLVCRFNTITIEIPVDFFEEIDELVLKVLWKCSSNDFEELKTK